MLKIFSIITLILYFFTAFVFFIGDSSYFPIVILIIPFELFILLLLYKENFFKRIIFLYKFTPVKYFFLLFIWIIITGILAVLSGYYSISRFLYAAVLGAILRIIFVFLYPTFVIPKIISMRTVIKIFIGTIFFIILWGGVELIGSYFDISIINTLVHVLSNIRDTDISVIIEAHSGIPRIRSVFMEPGVYASFLTINLPIIFKFGFSKYKIFKNGIINLLVKNSIIPLTIISLILTQSPIYFIFASITILFIYYKKIYIIIKKYSLKFILISIVSLFVLALIIPIVLNNIENSFLIRIVNVIQVFGGKFDLSSLIEAEGSLATRIVNYIIQFIIFLKHPIFGIGFGNNGYMLINAFRSAPIPLTGEMYCILQDSTSSITVTTNAFYLLLHQTGLVGFGLYAIFMVKIIQQMGKIQIFKDNVISAFALSLRSSIIVLFALSIIYNQGFVSNILFLYTSIACVFILNKWYYNCKRKNYGQTNIENN